MLLKKVNHVYELLYISVSPKGFSSSELTNLMECAQSRNSKVGVTGMLVYCGREFMQILEGEEKVVKGLFQVISKDIRHQGLDIFYEGVIENRAFKDWSMAFKVIDEGKFGALMVGHEEYDSQKSPMNMIKDNPNRGKDVFLSLRNTL